MDVQDPDNSSSRPRTPSPTRKTISSSTTTNKESLLHNQLNRFAIADAGNGDDHNTDQAEAQLFSTFVSSAASLALAFSGSSQSDSDSSTADLLDHLQNKDLGILSPHLITLGYGSSFIVSAFSDAHIHAVTPTDMDPGDRSVEKAQKETTSSTAITVSDFSNFSHIVFKRTIPSTSTPTSQKSHHRRHRLRFSSLMLELRVLTHDPIRLHPNVVNLLGIAWETDPRDLVRKWPVLIMERATAGTLADVFVSASASASPTLPLRVKLGLAQDVVQGLKVLHACGVLHGDVKMDNVLVFEDHSAAAPKVDPGERETEAEAQARAQRRPFLTAKLADFSGVVFDVADQGTAVLPSGTRPWNAPEAQDMLTGRKALLKTDIYSLGLLIWRIMADGGHPFPDSWKTMENDRNGPWGKVERIKREEDESENDRKGLRNYLKSLFGVWHEMESIEVPMLNEILDYTVRYDPEKRDLERVERILQEADPHQSPRAAPDFGNLQARQVQLKGLLQPFSYFGIDGVDRGIAEHIAAELIRTTRDASQPERAAEAAYGLAVITINGNVGDGRWQSRRDEGLQWLREAAHLGSDRAQALFSRFHKAFGTDLPVNEANQHHEWLGKTASRGFFFAMEELEELELAGTLKGARENLRGRYGGTGAERFDGDLFSDDFPRGLDQRLHRHIGELRNLQNTRMNRFNDNILHFAVSCGLSLTSEKLIGNLDQQALDVTNVNGETPLLLACRSGHYATTMMLLEAGANPKIASDYGDTPMHWVLSFDDRYVNEVTQKLFQLGAELDAVAKEWKYIHCGENAFIAGTPLMRAVTRNRPRAVEALLKVGADPNFTNDGASAINLAAFLHYSDILELLISTSTDVPPTVEASTGKSLLIRVIMGGSLEGYGSLFGRMRRHGTRWRTSAQRTLRVLLDHGACDHLHNVPGLSGLTALFLATRYAEPDILKFLLDNGCGEQINTFSTVPTEPETSRPPLAASIKSGSSQAFKLLLERGADAMVRQCLAETDEPVTLLYECAWVANDDPEFAEALIKHGVDVNDSPKDYETPLGCAVRNRCFSLARCLLQNSADVNIEYRVGLFFEREQSMTILGHLVAECSVGTLACLNFLFASGNLSDRVGFIVNQQLGLTVLHVIADTRLERQDERAAGIILETLLKEFIPSSKELNLTFSVKQYTALHFAVWRGNYAVARGLLVSGADPSIMCADGFTALELSRFLDSSSSAVVGDKALVAGKTSAKLLERRSAIAKLVSSFVHAA